MKEFVKLALISTAAAVLAVGTADAATATSSKTAPKTTTAKKEMKLVAAADVAWKEVKDARGVSQSLLWGGSPKSSQGALDKFAAGTEVPLHTHSHDIHAVVVSGTMIESAEGQPGTELGPGSYLFIPNGLKHSTACKAGADCVVFRWQPGPFDVKMVAAPPAKK